MKTFVTDTPGRTRRRLEASGIPYTRITIRYHDGRTRPGLALTDSAQIMLTVGPVSSQN